MRAHQALVACYVTIRVFTRRWRCAELEMPGWRHRSPSSSATSPAVSAAVPCVPALVGLCPVCSRTSCRGRCTCSTPPPPPPSSLPYLHAHMHARIVRTDACPRDLCVVVYQALGLMNCATVAVHRSGCAACGGRSAVRRRGALQALWLIHQGAPMHCTNVCQGRWPG